MFRLRNYPQFWYHTTMNVSFSIAILIIGGSINSLLALLLFMRAPRKKFQWFFNFLTLSLVVWAWTSAYAIMPTDDLFYTFFKWRINYAGATAIPPLMFFFAWYFLYPLKDLFRFISFSIAAVPILLALLVLFSNTILAGAQSSHRYLFGPYYGYFATYFFVVLLSSLLILYKKYRDTGTEITRRIEHIQIKFVLIGSTIPIFVGLFNNIILLLLGAFDYQWIGPTSTLAMTIFFTYAIFKHHLFDLKVITTEIFSAALALVLFLQIFFADTLTLRLISIGIFFGAAGFGILLVRSVIKEVRNREELERLAGELSAANEELKKLDKAKSEFISIASHQLRTPLSIIKGYISMIEEGSFGRITKKIAEPLRRVYLSNERLIKLVNDLLDLSRMEGGRMRYEMKPTQFSVIIGSVVEEFQQIAQSKGISLRFKKESEDLPVRLDEEKMRQVAFNLIDNAVRYTPKGGSITITLAINPYHLLFSVADTGIGLNKQELNSLFQKFVRSKEVARIHTEGVGLGLYVARRIVEDHGGRIWAESAGKGKGSAFFVELPIKKIAV